MDDKLEPCPFCGSEKIYQEHTHIHCPDCGCIGPDLHVQVGFMHSKKAEEIEIMINHIRKTAASTAPDHAVKEILTTIKEYRRRECQSKEKEREH